MRRVAHLSPAAIASLAIAACAPVPGADGGAIDDAGAGDAGIACSSGRFWTGGETGAATMKPGSRCIACHRQRPGAPRFLLAGTVMGDGLDVDDCMGVAGVVVRVVGADGGVVELTTNEAGNYYLSIDAGVAIALPYTASVHFEGRSRAMAEPQTMLDCTTCHVPRPGFFRVVAP